MNLVCPHCQKLVMVSDQNAGQMTSCPSCNQSFLVPSLPQTAHLPPPEPELPVDISLMPEPPAPERPKLEPSGHPEDQEGAYKMSSEPPKPRPKPLFSTYEREEISRPAARPAPISPASRATPSSPPLTEPALPPPGDYTHHRSITLNPRALPPFVMITMALLFFLLFFPWTGVYPGGYGIYTQTGFQTWYGGFSTDQVGEEALGGVKPFDAGDVRANWLMFFYFLLLLAALVLVFSPLVVTHGTVKLPPALQQIWPWRLAMLGAALALTFLILLAQNWIGFGIENAVVTHVDGSLEKERESAKTPEKQEIYRIRRGMEIARYGLQRTAWYRLAMFLQILTLIGVGLENWLERRSPRPLPRADFHW